MNAQRPVIGVIGAGAISHAHLPGLSRLAREVLIYSEDGAMEQAAAYGGRAVDSIDELLEAVDIVDIVTPTYTHYEITKTCLLRGKDVIVEKPLALTHSQALELLDIATRVGRRLHPAHVVRYMPPYHAAKQTIEAGRLGTLAVMNFSRTGAYPDRAWFADPQLSGGVVMDLMIHDLDIARWLAGDVIRVSATSSRREADGGRVEAAHALLTHASGVITQCTALWGPAHLPFRSGFRIAGSGGTLGYSSMDEEPIDEHLDDTARRALTIPLGDDFEDPYRRELADFIAAGDGRTPTVTAEDGLEAVRLAEAALVSIRTGQPVEL